MLTRVVSVAVPPPDEREIRRYAACPTGADDILAGAIAEVGDLSFRVAYLEVPVAVTESGVDLGFCRVPSRDLAKALTGCERALVFAATVGFLPDRLVGKYEKTSPAKALFANAVGAERVEALCDAFCKEKCAEYKSRGLTLRPRFSPGYGDLSLSVQKEISAALDLPRTLGITLGASLLMMPSKSVTAIAGIGAGK